MEFSFETNLLNIYPENNSDNYPINHHQGFKYQISYSYRMRDFHIEEWDIGCYIGDISQYRVFNRIDKPSNMIYRAIYGSYRPILKTVFIIL